MRISNAQIHKVLELHLHRVDSPGSASAASRSMRPDELILSSRATDLTRVRRTVGRLPELRTGLVNDFRNQVQSGTYRVNCLEVARNVLTTAQMNRGEF